MASGIVVPDHFEWRKVKPYLLYVGMFVATIYANMRALQHANVETIIVFRAVRPMHPLDRPQNPRALIRVVCMRAQCCPLIVCVLDWAFLGRQLPSLRSICALLVVASGCAGYVLTDRAFKLSGWSAYGWVSAYFVIISFEMAYGKHIVGPHLNFASSARAPPAASRRGARARARRAATPPSRARARAQCGGRPSTRTPSRCLRWRPSGC